MLKYVRPLLSLLYSIIVCLDNLSQLKPTKRLITGFRRSQIGTQDLDAGGRAARPLPEVGGAGLSRIIQGWDSRLSRITLVDIQTNRDEQMQDYNSC